MVYHRIEIPGSRFKRLSLFALFSLVMPARCILLGSVSPFDALSAAHLTICFSPGSQLSGLSVQA
jgi:hypothetical protein